MSEDSVKRGIARPGCSGIRVTVGRTMNNKSVDFSSERVPEQVEQCGDGLDYVPRRALISVDMAFRLKRCAGPVK